MNNHNAQRALFSLSYLLLSFAFLMTSCDDDTASIGVIPDADVITSTSESFTFTTRTVPVDAVIANSANCYLGQVEDPETGATVKAEFMAQFHTSEDYTLPEASTIVKNEQGELQADSVDVRLYYNSYFGDGTNPMTLAVYELDKDNILREDVTYYSDINFADYVAPDAQPLAVKTFTPSNYALTESERTSTTYYNNVRVRLPISFGTRLLRAAMDHPEYFVDSWHFIHNVLPGFYFQLRGGTGTMLKLDVSALNVHFRYVHKDSTYNAVARFSATPEVIQSTGIINGDLSALLTGDKPYTYLKSPAALATEVTLPVDEIFAGHEQDSVSRARIILTRFNATSDRALGVPSNLLMVRKADMSSFFAKRSVADGITTYTAVFENAYNTYTFPNISRLLATLFHEKQRGMAAEGLTSEQWNAAHPDWNRVVLLPVAVTTTTNQQTGITTQVSVNHDFSLNSIRLVGGTQPQQMQVIYSRYH